MKKADKAARKAPGSKKLKPNKFYKQIEKDGGMLLQPDGQRTKWIPLPKGRPRKDEPSEHSRSHSVRFPDHVWNELEKRAAKRGIGVTTLLRELAAEYLSKPAA